MSVSQTFIDKNLELSMEFDRYIFEHLELLDNMPKRIHIVLTVEGDDKFNADSLSLIKTSRRKNMVEAHKAQGQWSLRPLQAHSS